MEAQEIAAAARHFSAMARIVGPDPKAVKMRRHAFHLHHSGSTTLSSSALLLPWGALAEPPPLLDHICAARGHTAGDVALTAASLVEPFLVAEQRNNSCEELQPRLVPEVRLDVLVEVWISIGVEFVLSIQSPIISKVPLQNLDGSGQFSSKSAYRAFFNGSTSFEPWRRLWKSWAPPKCKLFLWLAIRNRCWTADRLAKRGLPHPSRCPLCDQEDENVQHLLTTCVLAREFWSQILTPLGLCDRTPTRRERSLAAWWRKAIKRIPKEKKRGLNSVIILGCWTLWKHRNACVFEGSRPCIAKLLDEFGEEHHFWCLAGARGLRTLGLGHGGGLG